MPPSPLRKALEVLVAGWREDEARLRAEGERKGCEKCVVAAECCAQHADEIQSAIDAAIRAEKLAA